jgi:hypothetical protein
MPTPQQFKIALNQSRFPLLMKWASQSVLVPSLDQVQRSQVRGSFGDDVGIDLNTPEIIYGENFIPTPQGVRSVTYTKAANPSVGATDFDKVFPLRDTNEVVVLYSPAAGKNYFYNQTSGVWTAHTLTVSWTAAGLHLCTASHDTPDTAVVTYTYVEGYTFVCYSRIGLTTVADGSGPVTKEGSVYFYDPSGPILTRVAIEANTDLIRNLPIPLGEIDGISSSNGYLLLWSGLTVYWGLFNGTAFDFQVYANGAPTGSGSQIPEDVRGPITAIGTISGGFVMFTDKNAVSAYYNSNNFASPWIFRGTRNLGGVKSTSQFSYDALSGDFWAYTTAGLQRVTLQEGTIDHPEVGSFLGARYIEHFNTTAMHWTKGEIFTELYTKITVIQSRFLVISYGTFPGIYSYALIYDVGLKRWGKLRLVHKDCFPYLYGATEVPYNYLMLHDVSYDDLATTAYDDLIPTPGVTYPYQGIAFLQRDGTVLQAVMDSRSKDPLDTSESFVVIGKCQFARSRFVALESVEISGIDPAAIVQVFASLDGENLESQPAFTTTLLNTSEEYSEFGCGMVEAKNFSVYMNGVFDLNTLVFKARPTGSY